MLEAIRLYSGDDLAKVRFYQASSSEMFGKVQEVPQREATLLWPRSPYGVAKVYGHYMTINYRESYGMHASSGILFNHESPRRGPEFVTRKVSQAVARISLGLQETLSLGNLDAKRDWGFAGDYVEAMWRMLQQTRPTTTWWPPARRTRSASSSTSPSPGSASTTGPSWSCVDPRFFRPAEVDLLIGDADQGPRRAGLEAHGRLPGAGRDDGRRRPGRAAGAGWPLGAGHPMPTAFVTGITGQDGSYLAERLLAAGCEVHGLVRAGRRARADTGGPARACRCTSGDLTDAGRGRPADRRGRARTRSTTWPASPRSRSRGRSRSPPRGSTGWPSPGCWRPPGSSPSGTGRSGAVVQASSAEIFGDPTQRPQDEATPIRPVTPYGAAKAYAHHMVGSTAGAGLHAAR